MRGRLYSCDKTAARLTRGKRDLNEKTSKLQLLGPSLARQRAPEERASLIVGVGASAGAMNSLERYLAHLSPIADQANVIVLQHREVLDEQRLRDALTKRDGLTLTTIKDGAAVEGGKVYLSDADVILTVDKGRFRTRPAQQQSGQRGTIDSFFVSLAEDQGERAVAVILYGTSGSGTLGVAAFKEAGGLTIAELGPNKARARSRPAIRRARWPMRFLRLRKFRNALGFTLAISSTA